MSCNAYVEAIVDLARGAEIEEETMTRLQTHLAHCAACTAQLRREQALTAGLAALARSLVDARPSGALEARLQQAFHERQTPPVSVSIGGRSGWRPWMAAAAAVVVVAGAAFGWRAVSGRPSSGRPMPVVAGLGNPVAPNARPANSAGSGLTSISSNRASPSSVRRRPPRPAHARRIVQPAGFVALPGAASLPEFESGTIERVALSLSSLRVYGVDIPPDAPSPIEADLLVGQDGQARAIRLVSIALASTSRPRSGADVGSKQ